MNCWQPTENYSASNPGLIPGSLGKSDLAIETNIPQSLMVSTAEKMIPVRRRLAGIIICCIKKNCKDKTEEPLMVYYFAQKYFLKRYSRFDNRSTPW
jgi:hypothetical protein